MFALTLQTQNAAFDPAPNEVARILRALAERLEAGKLSGNVHDTNGNRVGNYVLTED